MSETPVDDFDFFGSNTAANNTEVEQQPAAAQNDDLFGDFSSSQTEQQQNYNAPSTEKDPFDQELNDFIPPVNEEQWNAPAEAQKEPPSTEKDPFDQELTDFIPPASEEPWNAPAETQKEPPLTEKDPFDQELNDFIQPASEEQWNAPAEAQKEPPSTEKDPFDQAPNDFIPPASEEQWKTTEETQNEPPTAEEILSSSSPVAEDPKVSEREARVQAVNRRIGEELATRDEAEARRKADLLQQAKQDLERWYQERDRHMNEKRQQMKSEEDTLRTLSLEKSDKGQCDWAKLIRLLEFGPGSQLSKSKRDLTRMKAAIVNAKRHTEKQKTSNGD